MGRFRAKAHRHKGDVRFFQRASVKLGKFREKFKGRLGKPVILYAKDVLEKDGVQHLPLFMASFL